MNDLLDSPNSKDSVHDERDFAISAVLGRIERQREYACHLRCESEYRTDNFVYNTVYYQGRTHVDA